MLVTKKHKPSPKIVKFPFKKYLLPTLLAVTLVILSLLTTEVILLNKFYPRVFIGDTHIGFLTKNQAQILIDSQLKSRVEQSLNLNYQQKYFTINLSSSSARINSVDVLNQAFKIGHQNNPGLRLISQVKTLIWGAVFTPEIELELADQLTAINNSVYEAPQNALVSILPGESSSSSEIKISEGKNGLGVDNEKLESNIKDFLVFGIFENNLPIKVVEPDITTLEATKAKQVLEDIQKTPITLTFEDKSLTIDSPTLFTLLDLSQTNNQLIDKEKLANYLKELSLEINQPIIEPLFSFDEASKKVISFKPAQEGRELDLEKTSELISLSLTNNQSKNITLPVKIIQPKIKATQADNLGIKELLGQGVSHFVGSIPNRIYNVGLAASRINGVLIPPGEEFSFTKTVGDITAATGYKPAYVIKSGRTVLDDGGGVCQVSTTLYRAALNSGLPITARTAHAYRVGYYEQGFPPGLDATIFYPSVDFRFKNDTKSHILVQAQAVGTTLTVNLYGTTDNRVAYLSTPVITSQSSPPPEIRQDDPTLPKGEVKQVDWAAHGANVFFTRTVKRNGEVLIQETIKSNYRPWQAVYLVGTKEN
jgi:vancomycin resistance protein YoaR